MDEEPVEPTADELAVLTMQEKIAALAVYWRARVAWHQRRIERHKS